ncbi:iron-containing alcohol dehydrogenase [Anaerosacchariphilus polymeriproducens]|uniref:Iron-containing alcohol dehydrogenase n=1 Tax=Anaerosacchariphilus polymeriproducens TaxID=1812858 RepID=A0A371B003_9FIRM|nr:iron-containing alcohol dehydrogenase [Anaerosacchariphilus polymeriproducens]RDU25060.1 iron-containing alcohol dehydrogenase [Anaerosacchariphilus polymeriproducens]
MKRIVLSGKAIVIGPDSLKYLRQVECRHAFIVTGGSSMEKSGVIRRVKRYLKESNSKVTVYSGIKKNPTIDEVMEGVECMKRETPDLVLAIGGGSAMDAAKAMLLFYEFPELNFDNVLSRIQKGLIPKNRKTELICVATTSGTASEVTRGTVITDAKKELKVPIMTDCLRPDIAILDPVLTMTMPFHIAAETGMDALTHAIEAYTNHNLDDFNEGLCRAAIEGLMQWLPISCTDATLESREKVHNYQAMAGIGFANVGLGMVHGIAHSYGAIFNLGHGLANAIILPYVLEYNRRNNLVAEKLENLSYHCKCNDIVDSIRKMREELQIPNCFYDAGLSEEEYLSKFDKLVEHSMLGATKVNPVEVDIEVMKEMVALTYYGKPVNDKGVV